MVEGTPFGRYQLVELLGRGGMGEVWRAQDTETNNRTVAIKVLPPHLADDATFAQRFRREADAAARLNNPHIIPIHTYGEIDGRLYVDMRRSRAATSSRSCPRGRWLRDWRCGSSSRSPRRCMPPTRWGWCIAMSSRRTSCSMTMTSHAYLNQFTESMRTQVAIIGAGPAGMLLAHLLAAEGIDTVIVEARSEQYVLSRIRAGILEHGSVELLRSAGLGSRLETEGLPHRGIYQQFPHERHQLDFVDLIGRGVWVYGQTEVQKDLVAARSAAGQHIYYEASELVICNVDSERPSLTFVDSVGNHCELEADAVVGCDGSFGPSRAAIPESLKQTWQRTYPFSWLGILADVAPSTDELIYAWHSDGFAMHSMRSPSVSRLYLQVPNDTDINDWSHQRIWDALANRLGDGQNGWTLTPGPITEASVLPMRSYVQTPMRHGRLFLAGDSAHTRPSHRSEGTQPGNRGRRVARPRAHRIGVRWRFPGDRDIFRRRPAPCLALHTLLLVDDQHVAHLRRPFRRSVACSCHSFGGSAAARLRPRGWPRTTPAYPSTQGAQHRRTVERRCLDADVGPRTPNMALGSSGRVRAEDKAMSAREFLRSS